MPERRSHAVYLGSAAVVALAATAVVWMAWLRYQEFIDTPLDLPAAGAVFVVPPGSSGTEIVRQLAAAGYTRPGWSWKLLMRLEPRVYRSGEYQLTRGMGPRDVLQKLASGRVVQYRLTVVEGWTFAQMASLLESNEVLQHQLELAEPKQWPAMLSALGLEHPEGWFLPETYQFIRGDSDLDILSRAHRAMQAELEQAWASRADNLPLSTPYELLILASIIEKETSLDSERAQIAGVFVRRLQKGMRLQTDPTVIYGLGERFDGNIRRQDLQTDTPYNTYTRVGLPPTPIALPGRASLNAAAQPADGEALYFVADGTGGHAFSTTLEEHQAAVRRMLNRQ